MRVCPRCRSSFVEEIEHCALDSERLVDLTTDPWVGHALERYQIIERISQDEIGVTYRATHSVLSHDYSVKILFGDLVRHPSLIERFHVEAKSLIKTRHPNIVSVIESGSTPSGLSYIATEFIKGITLRQLIDERGTLSRTRAKHVLRQIVAGLGEAHRRAAFHRRLAPSRVLLTGKEGLELVKIAGFGEGILFAGTKAGSATGSELIPEEQDLRAIGAVLFEMLEGRPPKETERPPSATSRDALEGLCDRLQKSSAEGGFASVSEIMGELDRMRAQSGSTGRALQAKTSVGGNGSRLAPAKVEPLVEDLRVGTSRPGSKTLAGDLIASTSPPSVPDAPARASTLRDHPNGLSPLARREVTVPDHGPGIAQTRPRPLSRDATIPMSRPPSTEEREEIRDSRPPDDLGAVPVPPQGDAPEPAAISPPREEAFDPLAITSPHREEAPDPAPIVGSSPGTCSNATTPSAADGLESDADAIKRGVLYTRTGTQVVRQRSIRSGSEDVEPAHAWVAPLPEPHASIEASTDRSIDALASESTVPVLLAPSPRERMAQDSGEIMRSEPPELELVKPVDEECLFVEPDDIEPLPDDFPRSNGTTLIDVSSPESVVLEASQPAASPSEKRDRAPAAEARPWHIETAAVSSPRARWDLDPEAVTVQASPEAPKRKQVRRRDSDPGALRPRFPLGWLALLVAVVAVGAFVLPDLTGSKPSVAVSTHAAHPKLDPAPATSEVTRKETALDPAPPPTAKSASTSAALAPAIAPPAEGRAETHLETGDTVPTHAPEPIAEPVTTAPPEVAPPAKGESAPTQPIAARKPKASPRKQRVRRAGPRPSASEDSSGGPKKLERGTLIDPFGE